MVWHVGVSIEMATMYIRYHISFLNGGDPKTISALIDNISRTTDTIRILDLYQLAGTKYLSYHTYNFYQDA